MNEIVALVIGTVLAVGALAFVLSPLFFGVAHRIIVRRTDDRTADSSSISALREIEFDRATGKLSDDDYAALRRDYSARAVNEMRATAAAAELAVVPAHAPEPVADPVEAKVRAWRESHRECRSCGVRPESDAVYCSTCGVYLDSHS